MCKMTKAHLQLMEDYKCVEEDEEEVLEEVGVISYATTVENQDILRATVKTQLILLVNTVKNLIML